MYSRMCVNFVTYTLSMFIPDPQLCRVSRHWNSLAWLINHGPRGCCTNVSRALQGILSKFMYFTNCTSCEKFMLKFCTCAQSHALGTRTKFQLEILIINGISGIVYFRKIICRARETFVKPPPERNSQRSHPATPSWGVLLHHSNRLEHFIT